jgi:peptidoglycan/LPS O-acetylase OafA/YrhL
MFPFYLGSLIHKAAPHIDHIKEKATKMILFFALILWVFSIKQGFNAVTASIVLGVILLVMIPCRWPLLHRVLYSSPLQFLGRISYSFYLLHFPILFLTCGLLAWPRIQSIVPSDPIKLSMIAFAISVLATLIAGELSEKFIEQPWNRLGRAFSSRLILRRQNGGFS